MLTSDQIELQYAPISKPVVWVVESAYTGELHARIGLAKRLGFGYELIPIPSGTIENYAKSLQHKFSDEVQGCSALLIITGTGEETTAEIADLRFFFDERLFTLFLASILPDDLPPRLNEYDLIASPQLVGDNIITLTGVPHTLCRAHLAKAYWQHARYFQALPKPIIGLLIGGNTRYCNGFNEAHANQFAARVATIAATLEACLVISNSRRTPATAFSALLAGLSGVEYHAFDWQDTPLDFYHGLLAHADMFIVTGDSLSMCSEAAFTGKPVLVDLSEQATEPCHREIIGKLIEYGAAKPLTAHYQPWDYVPPDPTGTIAQAVLAKLNRLQQFGDSHKYSGLNALRTIRAD
ncbi:MAG: mitochondrial fission ELM1 family protein [Methylovulum sp.]|jgi:mitochondrial fission protein ELM1|nr:mitochondrial fission ELM1 family protein [Methylovulum sp.]MCF7999593.1 mitochondrial fission ELM1 family protein [Methylovulum sp.]